VNLSRQAKLVAGITLITVPTIEYGGSFLLASLTDPSYVANPLRHDLFRAGHAHAGVIVILSLVCQVLLDEASLGPTLKWCARIGAPLAAVLISAGFFLSALPASTSQPGGAISLVYAGGALLAAAVLLTAVGLLRGLRR
jgi:hypothetical protein